MLIGCQGDERKFRFTRDSSRGRRDAELIIDLVNKVVFTFKHFDLSSRARDVCESAGDTYTNIICNIICFYLR